jgi:hypothetical protein|tara:strand:+ start:63 stop:1298 length:1236 start_codon:yes stop_codon:yes gene_type:complete
MTTLKNLTKQLASSPTAHFCIAPFQSTRQNAHGRTSPCAFGAGEWHLGSLTPSERWNSPELNQLRQDFISGNKPSECHRCWDEEESGKLSLRQRQYIYFPDDYDKFIKTGEWENGPKTAVFKSSNICNLACRSCGGWDSNTFTKEGQYYATLYNTKWESGKIGNRFIPLMQPIHMDFMQYKDIAGNLEKIDFFGGEPFLNITQLSLLDYLVEKGLSKNITLFYSTNCTNHPTDRLKRAWNNFKRVEISVSIDGVGKQFEYLRWPGKWTEAEQVLDHILSLKTTMDCEVYVMAGLTISLLNMWHTDEIHNWLQSRVGNVYINMVTSPAYLSLHIAPPSIKLAVQQKVKHQEILGYLNIKQHEPQSWKQFIIWTKRQDLYRKQSLEDSLPELFNLIKEDWDSITDLSEENFNE